MESDNHIQIYYFSSKINSIKQKKEEKSDIKKEKKESEKIL